MTRRAPRRQGGSRGTKGPHRVLLCQHQPTGTVAWPVEYTPDARVSASVYCCDRADCIRDAADWVGERTGHPGEYRARPESGSRKSTRR